MIKLKAMTSIWLIISFRIISKHFKMYITINDIKGSKRIDLSYSIHPRKEIAVISLLSDNFQYEIEKDVLFIPPNSPGDKVQIESKTYTGRELISVSGMVDLTDIVNNDCVNKKNKLRGITEMIIKLNELDNTNNLEDGRPSNSLLTCYVDTQRFTSFEPNTPQYEKLKNGEFTSLTLRITDQAGNIITDGLRVTVVLHIRNCKI